MSDGLPNRSEPCLCRIQVSRSGLLNKCPAVLIAFIVASTNTVRAAPPSAWMSLDEQEAIAQKKLQTHSNEVVSVLKEFVPGKTTYGEFSKQAGFVELPNPNHPTMGTSDRIVSARPDSAWRILAVGSSSEGSFVKRTYSTVMKIGCAFGPLSEDSVALANVVFTNSRLTKVEFQEARNGLTLSPGRQLEARRSVRETDLQDVVQRINGMLEPFTWSEIGEGIQGTLQRQRVNREFVFEKASRPLRRESPPVAVSIRLLYWKGELCRVEAFSGGETDFLGQTKDPGRRILIMNRVQPSLKSRVLNFQEIVLFEGDLSGHYRLSEDDRWTVQKIREGSASN